MAIFGLALAMAGQAQAQPGEAEPAEAQARHEAMRRQRLEDLKVVLRLRPDQEAALAAFVAAHEPRKFEHRLPDPGAMTTPQRLDLMAKHEGEMRARHEQARAALARFYAALSPEQQAVFDALHRLKGAGPARMALGGPHGPHGAMMIRRHGPGDGAHPPDAPH